MEGWGDVEDIFVDILAGYGTGKEGAVALIAEFADKKGCSFEITAVGQSGVVEGWGVNGGGKVCD